MTVSQLLASDFKKFIIHLFSRQISAFIIILGRRGTGKTDFALLITEILKEHGVIEHVSTNTKIYSSPFPIEHITNLEDLRLWCQENQGKKLFLFDEIAKAMPRRRPMATLTVDLLNEFQVLRKFKLSILADTISEELSDNAILDPSLIDGFFLKPNWKNPKVVRYEDYLEPIYERWHDIPKTSIEYDTWDSSPFTKHGEKQKPKFKTQEMQHLWDLTHGVKSKDLGLNPAQVYRLWRKFVKEILEREDYKLQ